jgi:hypothetical protein
LGSRAAIVFEVGLEGICDDDISRVVARNGGEYAERAVQREDNIDFARNSTCRQSVTLEFVKVSGAFFEAREQQAP